MRAWSAGAAAVVLAAGLTGCGGGSEDMAGTCADGTFTWSNVTRTEKLTHLADPIMIKKRAGSFKALLRGVDTIRYSTAVSPVPGGVGRSGVLDALGKHLKADGPLGDAADRPDPRFDTSYEANADDLLGAYYAWNHIKLVDADFTYTCESGGPVEGHVRTWEGTGGGFLSCAEAPQRSTAAHEAAVRTCPTGSRAAGAA
ncbi:hypothetical protein DI272_29525 [Streptomyces sp. Act143]|uniref:hypothetical protein n=1 Tax=Streptomyces sp. Act143 TaxID=2200760 RepID=UPI000D67D99E|nr:hypothetical protein [Streptomyces sp. Act143]PWI17840.1 hypothetical protein DI272_29525 [Streptomyces sp. Act143]